MSELISKKELLELTKISYGQLYRWKRKKLIPEDWFIKKSSFTGQETYFPKEEILDRINRILSMKDDLSLDEIANMFSPNVAETSIKKENFKSKKVVDEITLKLYNNMYKSGDIYSFQDTLQIYILEQFIKSGEVSIDEGKNIVDTINEHYDTIRDKNYEILLLRKFGAAVCLILSSPNEICIEKSTKLIKKINLSKCIEEIKLKISGQK